MSFDKSASDASGGLVQQDAGTAPRYPSYQVDGLSAFAQSEWQVTEGLQLSAGVRQQHMDVEVEDFQGIPGGENDYDATLINAGALYDYGNGHQNWLQFSQGFELPDPAKYYGKSAEVSVAENPLSAIKTDQIEIGWRYRGADWMTQAALYYAWSDKAVENAEDLSVSVVEQKKRDYGFEGSVTRYFDNGFEVGSTLHTVRSEQKNELATGKSATPAMPLSPPPRPMSAGMIRMASVPHACRPAMPSTWKMPTTARSMATLPGSVLEPAPAGRRAQPRRLQPARRTVLHRLGSARGDVLLALLWPGVPLRLSGTRADLYARLVNELLSARAVSGGDVRVVPVLAGSHGAAAS